MTNSATQIDTVRASRAGHTFHERWAARRALQLVFPKDDLFAIVVEGPSHNETLDLGKEAEDVADLTLFYGAGDTFANCSAQQTLQFKYRLVAGPVTSSFLKKTIKKFAVTLRNLAASVEAEDIEKKMSFGFVTNAEFSDDLWDAISCLKSGSTPQTEGSEEQRDFLRAWCLEEQVKAEDIFRLIEFRASTSDLPAQNRHLRRTISDWSAESRGHAGRRLFALVELIREKSQVEGQGKNSIRREDVLDALECDEDLLFPADTRFVEVGKVVERSALKDVTDEVTEQVLPVFLNADGGVGKTVFIQSLAAHLGSTFEVVVFDCFGGGAYRSEAQARHLPRVGLLQIINELATRGLCDPLLPTDSDQIGMIEVARRRLQQATKTVKNQSALQGVLIVLDAADNAQLEAEARNEVAFPRLLLASLSLAPIDGVKLLLTARPHRMNNVIGKGKVKRLALEPFNEQETRCFLEARREKISDLEFSTAFARSRGNARVLEYLVESWDKNVSANAPKTKITVEELIAQKCETIFSDLHKAGWNENEIREFFAALSLLPPPIPLDELAKALDWSESQVNSAASDLAPMLELVKHGAIFRDEPTETFIQDHYAGEAVAQQSIADRLQRHQKSSIYAAEALPHFLVVIGDSDRAYELAGGDEFTDVIESEYGRRKLKLARLYAAFSLATREKNLDRVLSLSMQLSQVASANARGDQFIRCSPALATILGDSDTSRRLYTDRSGWRGARDARLVVAHCFSDELDDARIHQSRAIGWINWHLRSDPETTGLNRLGLEASDIAAVFFPSVLEKEFSSFNRNILLWQFRFGLSVIYELIVLCVQHEKSNGSEVLRSLAEFAMSKKCLSLTLHIGLLSKECGLSKSQLKAVSRAASALSQQHTKAIPEDHFDFQHEPQSAVTSSAMTSILVNSRQSAKRLSRLHPQRRPSSYDYRERHGVGRMWMRVQSVCIAAWSSGKPLAFHHLIPEEVKTGPKTKAITSEADLSAYLSGLTVEKPNRKQPKGKPRQKQFSQHEREDIVKGVACALKLIKPLETAILSKQSLSNSVVVEFLTIWSAVLRPNIHWNALDGRDIVAHQVGIGLAKMLLRHSDVIGKKEAQDLVDIVEASPYTLRDKLGVFALISGRTDLSEVAGAYANTLSKEILKDDYIEQRGESYVDLASSLVPMSIQEAQVYYRQGLSQLDQMGSDDYDLIDSALYFAAEQQGGYVKPELSHRLMNLCQTVFQDEPKKFGWTLFGRAAASSVGLPAVYKLIRWYDQDVVDYSSGLPQLVCYLARAGGLDPRRAAVLLTICEDYGWHDWGGSDGLRDVLASARPVDRQAIFSLVAENLDSKHSFGGSETVWNDLLAAMDAFVEVSDLKLKDHIRELRDSSVRQCEREKPTGESDELSDNQFQQSIENKKDDEARNRELAEILASCDPTSASSLDKAMQEVEANQLMRFGIRNGLFDKLRQTCPYGSRADFIEALCESSELEFDRTLDQVIKCVEAWGDSSTHVRTNVLETIKKLFAFKGSELFNHRYSGVSRQIHRLSALCKDSKFVLHIVLETIAKERLELSGNEWLQLATSLCSDTEPSTALDAFESLLSSSAVRVGDEIGEGSYRKAFAGECNGGDVLADTIWHLLGDSDGFVRWRGARALKSMLDVGLTEDVERLLDRFDVDQNKSLASDGINFAYLNAQQWMLIGLSRAALYHSEKLEALKPRLESLVKRLDLHVFNKLHLARCLSHIEGNKSMSPKLTKLWNEVTIPRHGIVDRTDRHGNRDRQIDFGFDYEFDKHEISGLARLFGISKNEASDCIAEEVIKLCPGTRRMSDIPGRVRYRHQDDDRFETYPEHIQKHALLHAATTLVKTRSVCESHGWDEENSWLTFLCEGDVSFEDGSWLSDHKDRVPAQARGYLLSKGKGHKEILVQRDELFRQIGFYQESGNDQVPLYGYWESVDGVHVRFTAALLKTRGAVGQCGKLSKSRYHDIWLPTFGSDGYVNRHVQKEPFDPLIWTPEKYPIGIDQGDEWAAKGAIVRPRLGRGLNKLLGLTPDTNSKRWDNSENLAVISNDVWGKWRPDADDYRNRFQDEGAILWAERGWLDGVLHSRKQSLIYTINFSKYKSRHSHDESPGIKQCFVGLKRPNEQPRIWYAKNASETNY